jgi:hypothetical protein
MTDAITRLFREVKANLPDDYWGRPIFTPQEMREMWERFCQPENDESPPKRASNR